MPTLRETILTALADLLRTIPYASVLRGEVLPERIPPAGLMMLRDGEGRLLGPDRQIEVELVESGSAGLAAAGTGQHAKVDDPGGALIGIGAEGLGEALDFLEREKPLPCGLRTLAEASRRIVGAHFSCDREAEHFTQHLAHTVGPHRRWLERLRRRFWFSLLYFEGARHLDPFHGFLPDPLPCSATGRHRRA